MKTKYLILIILFLVVVGVILISLLQKEEKQKVLLDNKEISCNSSKEKGREVCLSYAVNEMGKSIVWAGTNLVCEDNLCWIVK